jgi:hypothetical protein
MSKDLAKAKFKSNRDKKRRHGGRGRGASPTQTAAAAAPVSGWKSSKSVKKEQRRRKREREEQTLGNNAWRFNGNDNDGGEDRSGTASQDRVRAPSLNDLILGSSSSFVSSSLSAANAPILSSMDGDECAESLELDCVELARHLGQLGVAERLSIDDEHLQPSLDTMRVSIADDDAAVDAAPSPAASSSSSPIVDRTCASDDAELGALLSLDVPAAQQQSRTPTSSSAAPKEEEESDLEDWLDELLS